MGFPLHSTLGDLIQVTTHSRYLEGDFALMQSVMARLTQGEEVGQRIFATMFPEDQMMSLQPHTSFTAVLAPIAVTHQAGDAQILVKPGRVLVVTPLQLGVIQASNVY